MFIDPSEEDFFNDRAQSSYLFSNCLFVTHGQHTYLFSLMYEKSDFLICVWHHDTLNWLVFWEYNS